MFVGDAGMVSKENLRALARGGGRYIVCMPVHAGGEVEREVISRPGRYQKVAENLQVKEVVVVLKADVSGSLQVLKRELANLSTDEVRCKVIRDGVGGISTADVLLATADNAVVIGFGVTADGKAPTFDAIYAVLYHLLPNLEDINFINATTSGLPVPWGDLGLGVVAMMCWTSAFLLGATILFGRREF